MFSASVFAAPKDIYTCKHKCFQASILCTQVCKDDACIRECVRVFFECTGTCDKVR